jgi:tetratricopeptide (TPR) repeat protein
MNNHEALLNAAWSHFQNDEFSQALKILTQVVTEDSQNAEAWEMAGTCNFMIDDFEAASMSFELARKVGGRDDNFVQMLGECYYELGEYQQAIPNLLRAYEIDPKNSRTLVDLAQCYALLVEIDEATKFIKLARKSKPTSHQKQMLKAIEVTNVLNEGYYNWSITDTGGMRMPANTKEYRLAVRAYRKAGRIGGKAEWMQERMELARERLHRVSRRVFGGSWITLLATLVIIFFLTGGVKGATAERHLQLLKNEISRGTAIVTSGISEIVKEGSLQQTSAKMKTASWQAEHPAAPLPYRIGLLYLLFFVLYLFVARPPLYMAEQRKRTPASRKPRKAPPQDFMQPDKRADDSQPEQLETAKPNIWMKLGFAVLDAVILPLATVILWVRNFVLYI